MIGNVLGFLALIAIAIVRVAGHARVAGQTRRREMAGFDLICDVPGHKDAGMVGKLIVQP